MTGVWCKPRWGNVKQSRRNYYEEDPCRYGTGYAKRSGLCLKHPMQARFAYERHLNASRCWMADFERKSAIID